MPKRSLTDQDLIAFAAMVSATNLSAAARRIKIPRQTAQSRMNLFKDRGLKLGAAGEKPRIRVKAGSSPVEVKEDRDPSRPVIKNPPPQVAKVFGAKHTFLTRPDHTYTFGALGDAHLCSKYERLDVLNDLYDAFAAEGITEVFNTGNWIDGEARFNVHDIHKHGMAAQCRYLAEAYPQRPGITTYAVTGDDHEGWYAQRTGVDIGHYAEDAFRQVGRADWVNLGYIEAPVLIRDAVSGKDALMAVAHPGGGSSYALSYAIQKIVEVLEGGEKPAIGLYGHYHKLWYGNIRNVWCVQTGAQKDQDTFTRKNKIDVHVGGTICRATLDPMTGAVVRMRVELLRYFNKGYYAGRWSPHGDVALPARSLGGV
jgi:hypothetical protein